MAELQGRVRERLRDHILRHGGSRDFEDPALFAEVERLLSTAIATQDSSALLLPELLGDPETWRVETALHYRSHRTGPAAAARIFFKRRVLMPILRWLFEYSRDNFERQRRINYTLFACVQELAIENARLRRDVERLNREPGTGKL